MRLCIDRKGDSDDKTVRQKEGRKGRKDEMEKVRKNKAKQTSKKGK